MYYKHGAPNTLNQLLQQPELSKFNNIQTRFQLAVDYVRIMNYLHNSPIGVRVMCGARNLDLLLSQYLITDDFHMIVNDVDNLREVTENGGCYQRPNVSRALQREIERRGWPKEGNPLKFELKNSYDEKIDIWKLPWVVEKLLDSVKGNSFANSELREIMAKCHAIDPQQRPDANEVLQELLRVQQLIVKNSSYIY